MKKLLLVLIPFVLYAAGGDTLQYSNDVNNLADGDAFYADTYWHSMKDSVSSIINGRLGNINLAADANISFSKMDTTSEFKSNTIDVDTADIDSLQIRTVNVSGNITANSLIGPLTGNVTGDLSGNATTATNVSGGTVSATTGTFSGSLKTDSYVTSYSQVSENNTCAVMSYQPDDSAALFGAWGPDVLTRGRIRIYQAASNGSNGQNAIYIDENGAATFISSISATIGTFSGAVDVNSLSFSSGDQISEYDEGSFPCTLKTTMVTVEQVGTAYYTKMGNIVSILFPALNGTSNSGSLYYYYGSAPYSIAPTGSDEIRYPVVVLDNGANTSGYVRLQADGQYAIFSKYGVFTSSGSKGVLEKFNVTYTQY